MNPKVLDNLVKHVSSKSISDILVRLLNVSESVLDEGVCSSMDLDAVRQSFVFKVLARMGPGHSFEDSLNA